MSEEDLAEITLGAALRHLLDPGHVSPGCSIHDGTVEERPNQRKGGRRRHDHASSLRGRAPQGKSRTPAGTEDWQEVLAPRRREPATSARAGSAPGQPGLSPRIGTRSRSLRNRHPPDRQNGAG